MWSKKFWKHNFELIWNEVSSTCSELPNQEIVHLEGQIISPSASFSQQQLFLDIYIDIEVGGREPKHFGHRTRPVAGWHSQYTKY